MEKKYRGKSLLIQFLLWWGRRWGKWSFVLMVGKSLTLGEILGVFMRREPPFFEMERKTWQGGAFLRF